jgi:small subunit ribosomal protein S15
MLGSCISHNTSRCFARSLTAPRALFIHSSSVVHTGGSRKRNPQAAKKENRQLKAERLQRAAERQPHVVLGTRPGDEHSWANSDLAKALVKLDDMKDPAMGVLPLETAHGKLETPKALRWGVESKEKTLLLETLPGLTMEIKNQAVALQHPSDPEARQNVELQTEQEEMKKAQSFARLLDLRNSDSAGIAYENRRRIIKEFSSPQNPFDPGRVEVQGMSTELYIVFLNCTKRFTAALLTYKIRNLWNHLTTFKRDVGNRRALRKLVHQRAKILKYLKGKDRYRYDQILERLALEPESVEGELVV